jgi:hypothetical protein
MRSETNEAKCWEKVKTIRYSPFEHPGAATIVYSFLAGILASLAAQLFMTLLLTSTPRICPATLLLSAAILAMSSALMILISFELEAFKEDLIREHSPQDRKIRRIILEKSGIVHERTETPHRQFSRLWRLWVYLGISVISVVCAMILVWFD